MDEGFFSRWLNTKTYAWLYAAILVNGSLILYTTHVTFQNFPSSPDEYSYQVSAELFSTGRLHIPSPEPREFFDSANIVNNGTYYGKYPPGWPLLLALGKYLGAEWWVNPFFGLFTLILLFAMARALFSPQMANITVAMTLFCPYFIFNSACLMSHASGLLFLTLAAYFLLVAEFSLESALGLGMTSGFSFLIRPFTAVLVLAPLVLFSVGSAIRRGDRFWIKNFSIGAVPVASFFFVLYLFYNYAQTGHPLVQPFEVYAPWERLGFFTHTGDEYWGRLKQNIFERVADWTTWTGWMPLSLLLFWSKGRTLGSDYKKGLLLCVPFLCLLAGYFFYSGSGITQCGPRYLYESFSLILIPAALGLLITKRWIPLGIAVFLLLNISKFVNETAIYRETIQNQVRIFETFHRLSNAIVFIEDPQYPKYFIRNGLDFNGPVLLVRNLGVYKNREIITRFPGRSLYLYNSKFQDWDHVIQPYDEKTLEKKS